MKIRHPWVQDVVGFAGAYTLRAWMATLRFRYQPLGPDLNPRNVDASSRYLFAVWHETLLLPIGKFYGPAARVLISNHADGELMARACVHLGIPVVRGSTTRGGAEAVRKMLHEETGCHLAMTPDGPRGPRREVKLGAIYLAARTGFPIVPMGFGLGSAWRCGSWDRFALPKPGTLATCVTADPIIVPATTSREELEGYRLQVQRELGRLTTLAEMWAETGKEPARLEAVLACP